jgi:hypothetical protein
VNESLSAGPATPKRNLRRYVVSFALVFIAVFGVANSSPPTFDMEVGAGFVPEGGSCAGAYLWSLSGWPSPWIGFTTFAPDGSHALFQSRHWELEYHYKDAEVASWSGLLASVAVCGIIAAALVAAEALAYRFLFSSTSDARDRRA